jgi:hypothetical protein
VEKGEFYLGPAVDLDETPPVEFHVTPPAPCLLTTAWKASSSFVAQTTDRRQKKERKRALNFNS